MKLNDRQEVVFECSGRTVDFNAGIVGLRAERESRDYADCAFEGYDGDMSFADPGQSPRHKELSPAECAELAAHMMQRWRDWGKAHGGAHWRCDKRIEDL